MNPVGLWRNVDDKTGETKGEIRISDKGGVLSGVVTTRAGLRGSRNRNGTFTASS